MRCPNCSHANAPNVKFCVNCGARLTESPPPDLETPSQAGRNPQKASHKSPTSPANSLMQSLARLGVPVTKRQIVGILAAMIAGLAIARIMPFIYPIFAARPLDILIGPGASTLRDNLNTYLMTACTCLTSYVVAFVSILLFRKKGS